VVALGVQLGEAVADKDGENAVLGEDVALLLGELLAEVVALGEAAADSEGEAAPLPEVDAAGVAVPATLAETVAAGSRARHITVDRRRRRSDGS
jgi:hypothetical protein